MVYKNVGPLGNINLDMPFNIDGSPKPVTIVGENGSGKTTFLSNIIDSFYEMAGEAFNDVRFPDGNNTFQYYKVIGSDQIKIGEKYLYSFIQYDNSINYIFKAGNYSFQEFKDSFPDCPNSLNWNENTNYKKIEVTEKQVEEIFGSNIFCYFGADRYEKPSWIGEKYYFNDSSLHPSVSARFQGKIPNPISIKDVTEMNLQWLLDVIVDSRTDIQEINGQLSIAHNTVQDLQLLGSARLQVEKILSTIINKNVYFGLNLRNSGKSRFNIRLRESDQIVVPSLDALSTGELALFNMFSSIIRYADKLNINSSINFSDIRGIVIIDEIELHLHTTLQREVLPKLLKLFPKVQFIITSHSPLFLLGMQNDYGDDGFEIYQFPTGNRIDVEAFSEFQRAFDYMKSSQQYQQEVQNAIQDATNTKPLIITEGSTDWRHIKAAMKALSQQGEHSDLFDNLDVDFLEYDPKKANEETDIKLHLEMGNVALCTMCKEFAKIKQDKKLIFIADRDDKNTNKELGDSSGLKFKNWGNNVYSIILPIPSHRKDTPNICIEHYYTDEEIKTPVEINAVQRRLFIGNEFDEFGRDRTSSFLCKKLNSCGNDKINIIDDQVYATQFDSHDNYALSKMKFALMILKKKPPFDNFNFDSFLELFTIINEILNLELE